MLNPRKFSTADKKEYWSYREKKAKRAVGFLYFYCVRNVRVDSLLRASSSFPGSVVAYFNLAVYWYEIPCIRKSWSSVSVTRFLWVFFFFSFSVDCGIVWTTTLIFLVEVRNIAARRLAVCVELNLNGHSNGSAGLKINSCMEENIPIIIVYIYCHLF
jgi:hypothetical protein